jgi:hypothetical protein
VVFEGDHKKHRVDESNGIRKTVTMTSHKNLGNPSPPMD